MNASRRDRLEAIGRLFRYPSADYAAQVRTLAHQLADQRSAAAAAMSRLEAFVTAASLHELEETYTRTFDLNPSCAPEVGWHLFGEEYVRGLFMVRMRDEMRQRGLEETGELPDHVVHVLAVLGAMEEDSARAFARACVAPAVGKMLAAFDHQGRRGERAERPARQDPEPPRYRRSPRPQDVDAPSNQPFRALVAALAELLLEEFQLPRATLTAIEQEPATGDSDGDPLHNTPCGGCHGRPAIVPLTAPHMPAGSAPETRTGWRSLQTLPEDGQDTEENPA